TGYVLARALADQDALRRAGHALDVSVNITGRLLADADFAEHVLAAAGGADGRLWLEVTDAAFADDPAQAMRYVARLAEAGVGVSIDDFGAGAAARDPRRGGQDRQVAGARPGRRAPQPAAGARRDRARPRAWHESRGQGRGDQRGLRAARQHGLRFRAGLPDRAADAA